MTCKTCKFCAPAEGADLQCRRSPPQATVILAPRRTLQGDQLTPMPVTTWPLVRAEDWCGEHQMKVALAS